MSVKHHLILLSTAALLAACSQGNSREAAAETQPVPVAQHQRESHWFEDGQRALREAHTLSINNQPGAAKNIILFVGDGMGISTVSAARILAGQQKGLAGEEYRLSFETMPWSGLSKTYNSNQQTADSAGTMTALVTGVKTRAGVLSVAEDAPRGDCAASRGRELTTALELAALAGKSTGAISTARITHATPAATFAKVPERGWEFEAPEGCADIAAQLVAFQPGNGLDVAMGGGRYAFLPESVTDLEGAPGRRSDGRNLVEEWQQRYQDTEVKAVYIEDQKGFESLDPKTTDKLLALFNPSHMRYEANRGNDIAGEPSLSEMTEVGIDLLAKNPNGYFLMVEGGRIDHGHHAGNAFNALNDTVEFARAVQLAMDKTDPADTLIIVTADHSHTLSFGGYPTRGNPILGLVVGNDARGEPQDAPQAAGDGKPYTTLTYANGPGFADLGDETDSDARRNAPAHTGRADLSEVNTRKPGYYQEALVPMPSETHGGEDVGVWARGPGAHLISGTREQSLIFHVMAHAGGLLGD